MKRSLFLACAFALALALAACQHEYAYEPAVSTTTQASVAGRPASYYAIPPETPHGDIRLATLGLVDMHPQNEATDDHATHGIHLRMIVANNSNASWTVDTREQLLALPGRPPVRPAYASSDGGQAPNVDVAPHGKRTVDLFYVLPADMQKESKLPSFDVLWNVHTDSRLVSERTPFERVEIEPSSAWGYDYGWGPYWYDPYWYGAPWYGPPFVLRGDVVIHPHGAGDRFRPHR